MDETPLLAILRKLDFPRPQFEKDMADWSAGQKKKALIARSLCESAHLYMWDEPLMEFQPTLLFVEHDGAFQRNIATKTVEL